MSTTPLIKIKCLFDGCKTTVPSDNLLKDHLLYDHPQDLHKIPSKKWIEHNFHFCTQCNDKIFTSKGYLDRHIKITHTQDDGSENNLTRLLKYIPTPPSSEHKWNQTLPWLHNLHITPPPFRQNIWLKTNKSSKDKVKSCYHRLLQALISSPEVTNDKPTIPYLHRNIAIWKLAFIFESIILFPLERNTKETTSTQLNRRLHLLRTGDIKTLYEQSRKTTSKTPREKANKHNNEQIHTRNKCAQLAADNDNFRSAIDRITADTPIALNTPEVVGILKDLYPKKHKIKTGYHHTTTRRFRSKHQPLNLKSFIKIFSRTTKGKAAGPYGDITDVISSMVTHTEYPNNNNIYARTVFQFYKLIVSNKVPSTIKKLFNASFLFGLHKDPENKAKLRPVAVGGGWRRAFTSITVKHNTKQFTEFLSPHNYAIGVKGGSNFVYHTISNEIDKYITRSQGDTKTNPPTRCLVSLDIQNMFNEIPRERALDIINKHFPNISNLANLLLSEPTTCLYQDPDGEWKSFQQEEGLPQGCPFSPVLAALVLNTIITKLDVLLRERARLRKLKKILLDDNEGGITNLLAFVDDLNAVVPHEDVLFYCDTFKKLANDLGLRIREDKSIILTSTNNTSPMKHLPKESQSTLAECLNKYTQGKETTEGIIILGFPIGSNEFINKALFKVYKKVKETILSLKNNLDDIQTIGQLYNNSLLPKFYHTLCADVFSSGMQSDDIFSFKSNHTDMIKKTILEITQHMAATNEIPEYVNELISRPSSQNGLHILNPTKSSISASCAPLLRSIYIAKHGIPLDDINIKLPMSIQRIYANWNKSDRKAFKILKHHTPQIMKIVNKEYIHPISSEKVKEFIDKTPSHLIHEKIMHEYYNVHKDHMFKISPEDVKPHIPSILKSIIPTTLLKPCRQIQENRLNNLDFIISFRRSHRLPLFEQTSKITCTCNTTIDKYGDHFFSCRKHSKKILHDHIRNTTHFITSTIGPHANFISSKEACKMEETDLLPSFPSIRPGDITLHSNCDPLTKNLKFKFPIVAIDVTTIGNQSKETITPETLKKATTNRLKHHLKHECKKYDRPNQKIEKIMTSGEAIINELNNQNITLLPFTFDNFGSMGPTAESYFINEENVPEITEKSKMSRLSKPAIIAYQKARQNTKMKALFKTSNKGWKLMHKDKWFGSTYQLTTPSNWGKHYLGMNLNIALVQHIKKGFAIIDKRTDVQTENKIYKILGRQSIATQYKEPNHRKTQSKEITNTIKSKKKITQLEIPETDRTSNDNPFNSFYSSASVSALSKRNITYDRNRSTLTTYLQKNNSIYSKLHRTSDLVNLL